MAALCVGMAAVSLALTVLALLRQSYLLAALAAVTCVNVAVGAGRRITKALSAPGETED